MNATAVSGKAAGQQADRRPGNQPRLVQYRGLLPEQPANFLGRLTGEEIREVYVVLGIFPEVRGLLGAARLLHAYLKESSLAAARGRTTFQELAQERAELRRDIAALREKINRVAEKVCLILPRVPRLKAEEIRHADPSLRRIS